MLTYWCVSGLCACVSISYYGFVSSLSSTLLDPVMRLIWQGQWHYLQIIKIYCKKWWSKNDKQYCQLMFEMITIRSLAVFILASHHLCYGNIKLILLWQPVLIIYLCQPWEEVEKNTRHLNTKLLSLRFQVSPLTFTCPEPSQLQCYDVIWFFRHCYVSEFKWYGALLLAY